MTGNRPSITRRVTLAQWFGDAWAAWSSARAGIPEAGDLPLAPTGRQSEIGRYADSRIAILRARAQAATRPMEVELSRLHKRIDQLNARIESAEEQERSILGRPAERLPAEAAVPDAVVADRRAADNRKQADPVRAQIDADVAERDAAAAEAAQFELEILMLWRESRSRARAIGDVARRREARFWRILCRHHRDGVQLAGLFDHPRINLAPWVWGPSDERSQ